MHMARIGGGMKQGDGWVGLSETFSNIEASTTQ